MIITDGVDTVNIGLSTTFEERSRLLSLSS